LERAWGVTGRKMAIVNEVAMTTLATLEEVI
jgi:hypothetical protein